MTLKFKTKSKPVKELYNAYRYLKYFEVHIANDIRESVWNYIDEKGYRKKRMRRTELEFVVEIINEIIIKLINPIEYKCIREVFYLIQPAVAHVDAFDTFEDFLFDIILFSDELYYTKYDLKEIIIKLS